jgi:hypothetical protein
MKFTISLALYLINSGIYLLINPEFKNLYKNEFAAWYFGSEGLFTALLLYLSANANNIIAKQLVYVSAGFIGLRSIMYILNYTLIFTTDARHRMAFLCLYTLLIVVPVLISAYRHGHFNK